MQSESSRFTVQFTATIAGFCPIIVNDCAHDLQNPRPFIATRTYEYEVMYSTLRCTHRAAHVAQPTQSHASGLVLRARPAWYVNVASVHRSTPAAPTTAAPKAIDPRWNHSTRMNAPPRKFLLAFDARKNHRETAPAMIVHPVAATGAHHHSATRRKCEACAARRVGDAAEAAAAAHPRRVRRAAGEDDVGRRR